MDNLISIANLFNRNGSVLSVMVTEAKRKSVLAFVAQYQLVIWLVLVLARGAVFAFVVPPWQHPDEPTHFEHVRMIAESGRLPELNEVDLSIRKDIALSMLRHKFWRDLEPPQLDDLSLSKIGTSPLGIYTLSQPRLYYQVAAVWLKPWLDQPVETQLHAVRMLSVLLSTLIVLCAYLSANWLFREQRHVIATVCALIVFLPGFTDIMSAVNNDVLVNLFCALFFTLIAWWLSHRTNVLSGLLVTALLMISLVAAVATKATAMGLLVVVPISFLISLVVWLLLTASTRSQQKYALLAGGVVGLAVVAAVLVAVVIGAAAQDTNLNEWLARYLRVNISGTLLNLQNPQLSYDQVVTVVFQSYFAVFGWRHVYVAAWLYGLPLLGSLLVIIGLFVWATWLRRQDQEAQKRLAFYAVWAVVAVTIAWSAAILRSQADQGMTLYHSHGRYAYIALVPSAILAAAGLTGWLPQNWRWRGVHALILIAIVFDAVCFWGYLVPYYYSIPILGMT